VTTADEMRAAVLERMNEATMIGEGRGGGGLPAGARERREAEADGADDGGVCADGGHPGGGGAAAAAGQLIVGFAAETANIMEAGGQAAAQGRGRDRGK